MSKRAFKVWLVVEWSKPDPRIHGLYTDYSSAYRKAEKLIARMGPPRVNDVSVLKKSLKGDVNKKVVDYILSGREGW